MFPIPCRRYNNLCLHVGILDTSVWGVAHLGVSYFCNCHPILFLASYFCKIELKSGHPILFPPLRATSLCKSHPILFLLLLQESSHLVPLLVARVIPQTHVYIFWVVHLLLTVSEKIAKRVHFGLRTTPFCFTVTRLSFFVKTFLVYLFPLLFWSPVGCILWL